MHEELARLDEVWDVGIPGFLEAAYIPLMEIGATLFFIELNLPFYGNAYIHKNPAQLTSR